MKTKNKLLTVVEIAIVLCSVFLVATLPAAAITNYESGITNYEETAQEDETLDIYGNANEDDTIDMRDLTYVKLIFFGKKPVTELADAKYDGKINPLDFIQIKLIIVGKEKELTIEQYGIISEIFEPVTINMPIKRIVSMNTYANAALCAIGAQDRIVGVGVTEEEKKKGELKTFLEDKSSVGTTFNWDLEKIMELKPDIVLCYGYKERYLDYEEQLSVACIPLVHMNIYKPKTYSREMRTLGWMLDKKGEVEELINFERQHLNILNEREGDLKPEQKPRVYFEFHFDYRAIGKNNNNHDALIECGGINIFDDIDGYKTIDSEAVIERNPQVIIRVSGFPAGYDVTDTAPMEEMRNNIMSRPGWDHTDAVKNGRVYLIDLYTKSTHECVYRSYLAKMLHPELFEDIDPVDIHRDWFETFLGIEYKGVYVYPTYPV